MTLKFATDNGDAVPVNVIGRDDLADWLTKAEPRDAAWIKGLGFKAALGASCILPGADGAPSRVLIGLGKESNSNGDRFSIGDAGARLPAGTYRLDTDLAPALTEETALGWLLSLYRFDRYKPDQSDQAMLVAPGGIDANRVEAIAAGVALARDLVNTPANDMGPEALSAAAKDLADAHGATFRTVEGEALIQANLPLIHAVGRAGPQAPRLIDITWGDPAHPRITLVGKGVCFDTGGLDIKPSSAMLLMKKDMGGAASVLGLSHMIMAQKLPVRLRVLVPAVENSIASDAFRPGDVLSSRKGLTVEIGNTDAEGRLVLADALSLGAEEEPALMLDMATLTGAARVAMGPDIPPFYTDGDDWADSLAAASTEVRDPLWRLPLWPGYEGDLKSPIADLNNAPAGGFAGSITAALFLKRFVPDPTNWLHFDIYGWTPSAKPGRPVGGECQAARAVFRMLEKRYGDAG